MSDVRALPLQTWSRWHAVAMLGAALASALLGRPWPLAAVALPSVLALVLACRGAFTPRGAFGPANTVTALRFVLIAAAGLALHGVDGWFYCALTQLILILDGVDGWVARRTGSESKFGAHFDMESDAVLVLVLGMELWQRGRLGAWIVVPGLLRYVYVLAVRVFPTERGEAPRSNFGRRAFFGLVIGFSVALVLPGWPGTLVAVLGAALVGASFGRSFLWAYGR